MAVLFISPLCPDKEEYFNIALNRSGNNVLLGIAERLYQVLGEEVEFLCTPCVPSFPKGSFYIKAKTDHLDNGAKIKFFRTLNLKIIKSKLWAIDSATYIKNWSKKHANEERKVLIYNTYHPSVEEIYKACHKTSSKLYAILYDLGLPPARLGLSRLTMIGYQAAENIAHKYIPLLDGRIVINERIVRDYAPGQDFLLVDGGLNSNVQNLLFPLKVSNSKKLTCVCAGMLWDQNGTKLILDTLDRYPQLNINILFAGKGIDVPIIKEAAKRDERIKYLGILTLEALFEVYEHADVLFNLRMEEDVDYHFPSKFLEILATGKHVISTPVAHAERDYGHYATFLHNRTPEGLKAALEAIMSTDKAELYQKGLRAREFMLKNRNWNVQTDRILDYMHVNRKNDIGFVSRK